MQNSNTEDNFKPILDKPIIKAIKKDMKKQIHCDQLLLKKMKSNKQNYQFAPLYCL